MKGKTCQSARKDFQSQGKENPNHWEGKSKPGEANSKLLSSANRAFSRACGRIQIARQLPNRTRPAARDTPSTTPWGVVYDARLSTGYGVVPLPRALQAQGRKGGYPPRSGGGGATPAWMAWLFRPGLGLGSCIPSALSFLDRFRRIKSIATTYNVPPAAGVRRLVAKRSVDRGGHDKTLA